MKEIQLTMLDNLNQPINPYPYKEILISNKYI